MGMLEVVMLAMMGCMVILGKEMECRWIQDPRVCRWAKFRHLQHFVHEAGIPAGDICSWTIDYIIVRQEGKAKVRKVKVIPNEECVPKHKLLVMDTQLNTTERWRKKFDPGVCVWKLKEEKMT